MTLLAWVVLGFLAGTAAAVLTGRRSGTGCLLRIAVGILGAVVGGALAQAAGYEGVDEFGVRSVVVATLGATLLLLLLGAVEGRRS